MVGRWEAGIVPRQFAFVVPDRLAVCERPGGVSGNHRQVRRKEEILWLKGQGFTRVVSLLTAPYNLHAYRELGLDYLQFPLFPDGDWRANLAGLYRLLHGLLRDQEKVVVHAEAVDDYLVGLCGGFLYWASLIETGPAVIAAVEKATKRQLGPEGREIVAYVIAGGCQRGGDQAG